RALHPPRRTLFDVLPRLDTPRDSLHSRSVCIHPKKNSTTHHALDCSRQLRARHSARRISRDAMWSGLRLRCCHTNNRSIPRHPVRYRSIPCMQLHTPCSQCKEWNPSKMRLCSCSLPLLGLEQIEGSLPSRGSPRHDVTDERFRLHDPHVTLLRDRQQIVRYIATNDTLISPVIRESDLMHGPAFHCDRAHTRRDQHTRLDQSAWGGDGREAAVFKAYICGTLWRDFAEQLGL